MTSESRPVYAGSRIAMRPALFATLGTLLLGTAVLGGCPTVDLGDQPAHGLTCRPDMQYFHDHIWPEYLAPSDTSRSCVANAGCHQAASGRSALRLETEPVDDLRNYATVIRFLDCNSPVDSPLLSKPVAGGEAHGGGDIFPSSSDPSVQVFLQWFP